MEGYKTIYADPPWMERGGGKIKRGADRHYPLMGTEEIMALPVRDLIHVSGSHLYLWTTNNFLSDALQVFQAWGFVYTTLIAWRKMGLDWANIFLGIRSTAFSQRPIKNCLTR